MISVVILALVLLVSLVLCFLLWRRETRGAGGDVAWSGLGLPALVVALALIGYLVIGLQPETLTWLKQQRDYDHVVDRVIQGDAPGEEDADISAAALTRVLQARLVRESTLPGWYALGMLYDQLGAPEQVQEAARRALAINPDDASARLLLARGMVAQEDGRLTDQARAQIQAVLRRQPNHDGAWMLQAMAATEARRYDLAAESWRALLSRHGEGEAAPLIRQGLERAQQKQAQAERFADLSVTVDAPDLPDGGTLFVFLRYQGQGGQPLAARRILVNRFPATVELRPRDWLQDYPEDVEKVRVAARYTPAPGSSVDQANISSEAVPLEPGRQPAATLELRP